MESQFWEHSRRHICSGWCKEKAQVFEQEYTMEFKLKSISHAGIGAAIAKAERYRYLNEPEEAESICRDILAVDSSHQMAQRILGLAISDQFTGGSKDRFAEAATIFAGLEEQYARLYYAGILHERHAKAQLR